MRNTAESQPNKNTVLPMTGEMGTLDLVLHNPGPGYYYETTPHALFSFLSHTKAKSLLKQGAHQS